MISLLFLSALALVPAACEYSSEEIYIPTQEGSRLYTVAFFPLPLKPRATVLFRTPYGAQLEAEFCLGAGKDWVNEGYNCMIQDFRGLHMSEGQFTFFSSAASDGNDTINYITSQPYSNGVVFTDGGSALGIAQYLLSDADPQLGAQWISDGSPDLDQTVFQNGAYRKADVEAWLTGLGGSPDVMKIAPEHESDAAFWEARRYHSDWTRISWPAVHLAGWYDVFGHEQLHGWYGYRYLSDERTRAGNFLFMEPTGHCLGGQVGWPNAPFGKRLAGFVARRMFWALSSVTSPDDVMPALEASGLQDLPHVWFYVMGPAGDDSMGNYWTGLDAWPEHEEVPLYLHPGGSLRPTPSAETESRSSYEYDPSLPYPTRGGNNLATGTCGPYDLAELEVRPDVLTFTSEPLSEPLAITGPMSAVLYVSSNCTDTDFTATVTDVYPDGTSMLLQAGVQRMRWLDGHIKPVLMTPTVVYKVTIDVWNISYVFSPGHKIRVDVSSSSYPRYDANPNNGLPINQEGPILVALNSVYHDATHQSALILPKVPLASIPRFDVENSQFSKISDFSNGCLPGDALHNRLTDLKMCQRKANRPCGQGCDELPWFKN